MLQIISLLFFKQTIKERVECGFEKASSLKKLGYYGRTARM